MLQQQLKALDPGHRVNAKPIRTKHKRILKDAAAYHDPFDTILSMFFLDLSFGHPLVDRVDRPCLLQYVGDHLGSDFCAVFFGHTVHMFDHTKE